MRTGSTCLPRRTDVARDTKTQRPPCPSVLVTAATFRAVSHNLSIFEPKSLFQNPLISAPLETRGSAPFGEVGIKNEF